MFTHHLFWVTLALLFCAAMNINVYFKYSGSNTILQDSIGILGIFGLITGHARFFMISIELNWWWFFGGITISVVSIGLFSFLFRSRISSFFAIINSSSFLSFGGMEVDSIPHSHLNGSIVL